MQHRQGWKYSHVLNMSKRINLQDFVLVHVEHRLYKTVDFRYAQHAAVLPAFLDLHYFC